jgi:hypothetical protein
MQLEITTPRVEQAADAPTIAAISEALAQPGATLGSVLRTLAASESFRTRPIVAALPGGMP